MAYKKPDDLDELKRRIGVGFGRMGQQAMANSWPGTKPQEQNQVQSNVDIRPQPESKVPTVFPKYEPQVEFKGDRVIFKHGEKMVDMSKGDWEKYRGIGRGGAYEDEMAVNDLGDYETVQRGLAGLKKEGIPDFISSQSQLDYFNALKNQDQEKINAQIKAIAERESAKGVESLKGSGNELLKLGFVGSSIAGSDALSAGGIIAGGAGAGALAGGIPGAVIGGVVGTAIAAGKGLLAYQGKNRSQDILNAKGTSQQAQKYLNFYKTEALNPQADKDDLIGDYYEMKRQVYASRKMLYERSLVDIAFRINEGADELAKIELWMANEDNLDRDFFNNLAYSDGAMYQSQIGQALNALNQESPK